MKYRALPFAIIPNFKDTGLANPGVVSEKEAFPPATVPGGSLAAPSRKLFFQAMLACLFCVLGYRPAYLKATARPSRYMAGQAPVQPFWPPGLPMLSGRSERAFENRGP